MLVVNGSVRISLRELQFTYVRSSGPGGQKVNKTSSRAVLRWNLWQSSSLTQEQKERLFEKLQKKLTETGDIVLSSDRFRDRGKNTADCLEKLRAMLEKGLQRPKARVATRPTKASVKKRQESKKHQSDKKKGRQRVKLD